MIEVIINGKKLDDGLAHALRVACTNMLDEMQNDDALGEDGLGRALTVGYRQAMTEILEIMGVIHD